MLEYARKICNPIEICKVCPLVDICREMVPITKEALTDWENRIEAKAKEICEVNKDEENKGNPIATISYIDAISKIDSRRSEIRAIL